MPLLDAVEKVLGTLGGVLATPRRHQHRLRHTPSKPPLIRPDYGRDQQLTDNAMTLPEASPSSITEPCQTGLTCKIRLEGSFKPLRWIKTEGAVDDESIGRTSG
ncbi:hypothetical protein Q0Z83_037890 [Actinoplanes sichuanensis]|uniref:Ig-like domain-containing protein n=1 Tax=Actinoplanes sichuanensis TaxID=512349 RepID=A0ABW4A3A5_9ACTN|nr:hypothetical protein [Actinoplanes sichuanensis]BEL05598.1 hypothetical protein Q0Z83_037890 [Actinoplanes sichuanensis]